MMPMSLLSGCNADWIRFTRTKNNVILNLSGYGEIKKRPVFSETFQFGVILYQPAAGQAKEKFFFSTNFSGAAGETE